MSDVKETEPPSSRRETAPPFEDASHESKVESRREKETPSPAVRESTPPLEAVQDVK